ncbi:hypothetical protein MRX96_010936 [Rhipicephalus microplus]
MYITNLWPKPITLGRLETLGKAEPLASSSVLDTMDDPTNMAALETSTTRPLPRSFTPAIASDLTRHN